MQVWGESVEEGERRGREEDFARSDAIIAIVDGYGLTRLLPFVISLRRSSYRGGLYLFMIDVDALYGSSQVLSRVDSVPPTTTW
jgi:hypothetical protein